MLWKKSTFVDVSIGDDSPPSVPRSPLWNFEIQSFLEFIYNKFWSLKKKREFRRQFLNFQLKFTSALSPCSSTSKMWKRPHPFWFLALHPLGKYCHHLWESGWRNIVKGHVETTTCIVEFNINANVNELMCRVCT